MTIKYQKQSDWGHWSKLTTLQRKYILMKFSSLASQEVVKMTSSCAVQSVMEGGYKVLSGQNELMINNMRSGESQFYDDYIIMVKLFRLSKIPWIWSQICMVVLVEVIIEIVSGLGELIRNGKPYDEYSMVNISFSKIPRIWSQICLVILVQQTPLEVINFISYASALHSYICAHVYWKYTVSVRCNNDWH